MIPTMAQAEDFLKKIDHITCSRWLRVVEIVGEYVIVQHRYHAEYINRFDGSKTCEACHAAFLYEENPRDALGVLHPLAKVLGRYNKQKRLDLLAMIEEHRKDAAVLANPTRLKVFACNMDGRNQYLVAAKSRAAAHARLFTCTANLSRYHFDQFGHETGNAGQRLLPLLAPGTVFLQSLNGGPMFKVIPRLFR